MQRARNKKVEINAIKRDLTGERFVPLSRAAGDSGTDEGERKSQLIWQNFRIENCTKASAIVLGTEHQNFLEGKEAAAANSAELFETELINAGGTGVALEKLSSIHAHYFGSGFERVVGKKLRNFVDERYNLDSKTGIASVSERLLGALRKREAKELMQEEMELQGRVKRQALEKNKRVAPKPPSMAPSQVVFDPDQRPRYATTKMQPDELEERAGGFDGKGGGKGLGLTGLF